MPETIIMLSAKINNSSYGDNVAVRDQSIIMGSILKSNITINRRKFIQVTIDKYRYIGVGAQIRALNTHISEILCTAKENL